MTATDHISCWRPACTSCMAQSLHVPNRSLCSSYAMFLSQWTGNFQEEAKNSLLPAGLLPYFLEAPRWATPQEKCGVLCFYGPEGPDFYQTVILSSCAYHFPSLSIQSSLSAQGFERSYHWASVSSTVCFPAFLVSFHKCGHKKVTVIPVYSMQLKCLRV